MNGFIKRTSRKVCLIHYLDGGVEQIEKAEMNEIREKEMKLIHDGHKITFKVYRYMY